MARPSGTILALAAAAILAVAGEAYAESASAPADKSFGPFGYTPISIRTKITALARAYRERWADDASIVHDAGLVESSYRVWAQRYPHDPWLAPTAFHLAQLYAVIQSPQARAKATETFRFVAERFSTTKEGRLARQRLKQGLPALRRESAVSRTPSPYAAKPSPVPAASTNPSVTPSAPASGAPSNTPLPSSSKSPAPKP